MSHCRRGVVILGAGGHAKVVVASLLASGGEVRAVLDDDPATSGRIVLGISVDGPIALGRLEWACAVAAIGDCINRERVVTRLPGTCWHRVIHPSAIVDPTAVIGEGTVVLAGAIVQPDARVGSHVIINSGAIIEHDCAVGDFAHVAPGARLGGGVRIGRSSLIGIGAVCKPGVVIGDDCVIGAGAALIRSVPSGSVVVGNPGRILRAEARRPE